MSAATDGPTTPPIEPVFVDEGSAVRAALASIDAPVLGIDVERADADRYFRRAALVQIGTAEGCVLLDTVALDELHDLDTLLDDDHLAVLHAADNDLAPLQALGVSVDRIADTAVAAALLGLPTGLSRLLEDLVGVHLSDDKNAFQRADWEQRPLPPDMAAYAAGDVVHLPALWSVLAERLEDQGRTSWYAEELAATIARAGEDTRDWTRVKGAGRLDPGQRAILRALWEAREAEARTHDIAPNRLIHDDVLRELAIDPPRTEAQLVRRSPRRRGLLRQHAAALFAGLESGRVAAPQPRPDSSRWTEVERGIHDALRSRRAQVAEEIGLEAGVLCPSKVLSAAVMGEPADGVELCTLAGLRTWQTALLAEPLWEAYVAARERTAD